MQENGTRRNTELQTTNNVFLATVNNNSKLYPNGRLCPLVSTYLEKSSLSDNPLDVTFCNRNVAASVRSLSCQNLNKDCKQLSDSNLYSVLLPTVEQSTTDCHETPFTPCAMSELTEQNVPLNEERPSDNSRRESEDDGSSRRPVTIIVGVVSAAIFLLAIILIGVTLSLTPHIDKKNSHEFKEGDD
ncbi:uncharacterized protein LOC143235304 [Tachypleus tridentatus]|uniref:uncharacterized protein LOC143235304 n=1 Tax=Tachypleus tridentatus TaxID=6853 RepID=UPI003FD0754E